MRRLRKEIRELEDAVAGEEAVLKSELASKSAELSCAAKSLAYAAKMFDVRKLAAFTKAKNEMFFILCGWMAGNEANSLKKELENDPSIFCTLEENPDRRVMVPPTRLKNPALIRPFEMFIRMYGLPNYQEFESDAVCGDHLFGHIRSDVRRCGTGTGAVYRGLPLYFLKKMDLAAIIASCGFFSTIFGFLYGSIFGFEHILPALWLHPAEAMTNLPFIGTLNTVFIVTIALGMGLILLTMVFHIINAVKAKKMGEALFDTNGVAGMVFYGAVVLVVVLFMTGNTLPAAVALIILFVLPLLVIACKEPLTALLEKKKHGGIGRRDVHCAGVFRTF